MQIVEVNNKKTIKLFHKVPFVIYKNDPHWVPHLKQDVEKVFTPDANKAFRHGEACRWIATNDKGELIGRVAAFYNKKMAETNKQPTGGIGFFESINDKAVAFALLDTGKKWLEERGMEAMDGPINFGEKDKFWGLITENFERPPYYGQNYNPDYYVPFFEEYGFKVYYEQYIYYRSFLDKLQPEYLERAQRIANNPDYELRHIEKSNLEKYAEDFREVYNRAWGRRDGDSFKGMPKSQAMALLRSIKVLIDEDITWFAYYKGQPVAFYISLPEVNEIFKYVNGNLNWWGKLKFLYYKWRGVCKTSFGIVFGIDPEFQGRGVEGALFNALGNTIQPTKKYEHVVITWIGDFNPKMIRMLEVLGATKMRTMATYRFLFDRNASFERFPIKS